MAAPQLQEITVKVSNKILLNFDSPLDTDVNTPLACFSVNYGKIPLASWEYYGTAGIVLTLARSVKYRDKLEVNYQPPEDLYVALRAPIPNHATNNNVIIRRNAVRAFFRVPILNMLKPNEGTWNENSNLGASGDKSGGGNSPEGGENGGGWEEVECGDNGSGDGSGSGSGSGGNGGIGDYGRYPIQQRPNPRTATPDDFILAFGLREAIQLSHIDDADAIQPNTDRIWMAIQDASALIDNYIVQASRSGKLLISSNRRRTALIIARYYLDSVRRREDVKEDYERCIKELDKASAMEDLVRPDEPWWADPCNPNRGAGVRSWRIPQYYNGVSGKGLSGWWTDSAANQANDTRYNGTNAEKNNDEGNGGGGGGGASSDDTRVPQQPTDNGGSQNSGNSNQN